MGLCCDRVFSVTIEYFLSRQSFVQDQRVSCRDIIFCVATELVRAEVFYRDIMFLFRDRACNGGEDFCRDIMFLCRDRVWPNGEVLCCNGEILCHDIVCQAG